VVFPKIFYCHRGLFCGASGLASDLVASTHYAGMEDRTHHRNPCSHFDPVPSHEGNQFILSRNITGLLMECEIRSHSRIFVFCFFKSAIRNPQFFSVLCRLSSFPFPSASNLKRSAPPTSNGTIPCSMLFFAWPDPIFIKQPFRSYKRSDSPSRSSVSGFCKPDSESQPRSS
jgi:hypothetical protein